jgi:hypothetical protein
VVTFTVLTFGRILKTLLPIDTGDSACPLKIRDQAVTFLVDLRFVIGKRSTAISASRFANVLSIVSTKSSTQNLFDDPATWQYELFLSRPRR